jgi:hypothetical protein
MRHKAVPAATIIVAAGLIGITQARLPRPIRDYRERVSVEMSTIALLEDTSIGSGRDTAGGRFRGRRNA